jgi:DNA-binding transcriptional regulator YhcF (GntR family)
MIYDQRTQKEKPVKMQLTPEPKTMIASAKLHSTTGIPTLRDLAIHPKFALAGNNFLIIQDTNEQVQVCKA